jgi:hypothetical protein
MMIGTVLDDSFKMRMNERFAAGQGNKPHADFRKMSDRPQCIFGIGDYLRLLFPDRTKIALRGAHVGEREFAHFDISLEKSFEHREPLEHG